MKALYSFARAEMRARSNQLGSGGLVPSILLAELLRRSIRTEWMRFLLTAVGSVVVLLTTFALFIFIVSMFSSALRPKELAWPQELRASDTPTSGPRCGVRCELGLRPGPLPIIPISEPN